LKEDRENIIKAKDALELADTAQPSIYAEKLNVALEELSDLKGCQFRYKYPNVDK
jgi:dynein heavy chain 1